MVGACIGTNGKGALLGFMQNPFLQAFVYKKKFSQLFSRKKACCVREEVDYASV